jgi:hypothetical protein
MGRVGSSPLPLPSAPQQRRGTVVGHGWATARHQTDLSVTTGLFHPALAVCRVCRPVFLASSLTFTVTSAAPGSSLCGVPPRQRAGRWDRQVIARLDLLPSAWDGSGPGYYFLAASTKETDLKEVGPVRVSRKPASSSTGPRSMMPACRSGWPPKSRAITLCTLKR